MVKRLVDGWNNGERPTIITVGFASAVTLLLGVAVFVFNLAMGSIDRRLDAVNESLVREVTLVREDVNNLRRQVERIEDREIACRKGFEGD